MAKKKVAKKKAGSSASTRTTSANQRGAKNAAVKKKAAAKPAASKRAVVKKKAAVKKAPASSPAPKRTGRAGAATTIEGEIKQLDRDILKLVNRRANLTTKQLEKLPNPQEAIFNPRADDELWTKLEERNPGPLPANAVRGIFREILSAARRRVKTQRVAYLGPPFSFTHLATIERFGEWADLCPVSTIAAVFDEVNRGHADYGIVPIENSTDGRVVDTLDMFTRLPLRICGEVQINVHHNLLARCARSEITEIYSKPQALSQCRDWLARNKPQARLIEVPSTSTAAQLARDKPGAAAVASRQASIEYGLQIIADDIEDNSNNVTRFAVIGGESTTEPTGKDRTAVLLQIPHQPGSLSDALIAFQKNKINLTWIESFPLRGPESGYLFFMDFEGHTKEPRIKKAIEDIEKKAVSLSILGSYPRSEPLG